MPHHMLRVLALLVCSTAALAAADAPAPATTGSNRFLEFFERYKTTNATLSPDGRHLAYSVRNGDKLGVAIVNLDAPGRIKTFLDLGTDDQACPDPASTGKIPLAITWMRWATAERLVIMTNEVGLAQWPTPAQFVDMRAPAGGVNLRGALDQDSFEPAIPIDNSVPKSTPPGKIVSIDPEGKAPKVLVKPGALSTFEGGGAKAKGPETETDITQAYIPLRFSILGFAPDDKTSLLLTANDKSLWQLHKLNPQTGTLKQIRSDILPEGFLPLHDRQGLVRGGLAGMARRKPPFHYLLENPGKWLGQPKALDDLLPGENLSFNVSPENQFGHRSIPLCFDENPDLLYYASNVGRDTFGIYALNVKTKERTKFALELPELDLIPALPRPGKASNPLVFDRYTNRLTGICYYNGRMTAQWLRPELQAIQEQLEQQMPDLSVRIIEWDKEGKRFLVLVYGPSDPGTFYICEPASHTLRPIVQRMRVNRSSPPRAATFSFTAPAGHTIRGRLVLPEAFRTRQIPIVVRCPPEPWSRMPDGYQPETQALAAMGFAVLQIDGRGAWGYGTRQRQLLSDGWEKAILEDIQAAVERVASRYRIDVKHVALLGRGYGGFIALRGLQLHPEQFSCAVAIDPVVSVQSWIDAEYATSASVKLMLNKSAYGDDAHLKEASLLRPPLLTKPVCLFGTPGLNGAPSPYLYRELKQLSAALESQGSAVEFNRLTSKATEEAVRGTPDRRAQVVDLGRGFLSQEPAAQAAVYQQIEYFLNTYLYDYKVDLGPLQITGEDVAIPEIK